MIKNTYIRFDKQRKKKRFQYYFYEHCFLSIQFVEANKWRPKMTQQIKGERHRVSPFPSPSLYLSLSLSLSLLWFTWAAFVSFEGIYKTTDTTSTTQQYQHHQQDNQKSKYIHTSVYVYNTDWS